MSEQSRQQTPTLPQVIKELVDARIGEINTTIPGQIVSYDYDKNLAVVKPLLKTKYKLEDSAKDLPLISNVPIEFPRLGPGHLRIPVNPGDYGRLVFSQRSIDQWMIKGGSVDPEDNRKHSMSDACFVLGLNPNTNPIDSNAEQTSLELKLNGSHLEILNNGKFKVTNGTEELFNLLVLTLDRLIFLCGELGENDTTNTIFGPLQPNNFLMYQDLKVDFTDLKARMETLKG